MKKLLGILVLGLFWCNVGFGETLTLKCYEYAKHNILELGDEVLYKNERRYDVDTAQYVSLINADFHLMNLKKIGDNRAEILLNGKKVAELVWEGLIAKEMVNGKLINDCATTKSFSTSQPQTLTTKDTTSASNSTQDQQYESKAETEIPDGFNIINVPLEGTNAFIHVEAYFENNCAKHGLFQQINPDTNKSWLDTFGIFNNCLPLDALSKVAKIVYEDDGKLLGMDLFKKDVSHIYGNKPIVGVSTKSIGNQNGIEVISISLGKPFSKTKIKEGDILLKLNGVLIKSSDQFGQLVRETAENNDIIIEYIPKEFVNNNFEFNIVNLQSSKVKPEYVKRKVGLHVGYNVRLDFYYEGLNFGNGDTSRIMDEVPLDKGTEAFNDRQSILKQEFFSLKKYYDSLRKVRDSKISYFDYNKLYIVSNKKVYNKTTLTEKQNEFIVNKSKDNNPPVINVAKNVTVNDPSYQISGKVEDDTSENIYIEIDGVIESAVDGSFTIKRFSPVNEVISIVAIDKWGNRSKPSLINVKIDIKKTVLTKKIERLNPSLIKTKTMPNRVALIIGIENYTKAPKATYANLDAKYFYEYVKTAFGVNEENIKLLINEEANLIESLGALNKWLPGKIKKNKTELIIYFAGHGLASNDGKELYLLPQDGDTDLLTRTGISRSEIFQTVNKLKPKSVMMFLDTCYSGVSRDEETLLASARPIRIVADDQEDIPDNFIIFSASQLDQISSGLKEAKHGIFSYYLMKGLEGKADNNKDKKITNGELLAYMDLNVSQKAAELGRQQNPSLMGDPDQVLMRY